MAANEVDYFPLLDDNDVVFELDCSNRGSDPETPTHQQEVHQTCQRHPRTELRAWLTNAISAVDASSPRTSGSLVKIAAINLRNDEWTFNWGSSGDLGRLFEAVKIPPEAYISGDVLRWHFFPPTLNHDNDSLALDDQITVRSVASKRCGVAWRYYPKQLTTIGVAWFDTEDGQGSVARILEDLGKYAKLSFHPLLLSLITVEELATGERRSTRPDVETIWRAQLSSGFHAFRNRTTGLPEKKVDFGELSARVSGCTSNLINNELIFNQARSLALAIISYNSTLTFDKPEMTQQIDIANRYLESQARYLAERCSDWIIEAESFHRRGAVCVQGIFNKITQLDSRMNLSIAQDSKTVAEESKKDSASMKAIAAVTMLYLPGTFLASFLAMPIFVLDPQTEHIISHQMWLYWAIAIPLTLATMSCWLLWDYLTAREQRKLKLGKQEAEENPESHLSRDLANAAEKNLSKTSS